MANPYGADSYGTPFQSQQQADAYNAAVARRNANLNQWQQGFEKELQASYASPMGQMVAQHAAALGPNAGEHAITNWMQGGPMDLGLAANMVNQTFSLNDPAVTAERWRLTRAALRAAHFPGG